MGERSGQHPATCSPATRHSQPNSSPPRRQRPRERETPQRPDRGTPADCDAAPIPTPPRTQTPHSTPARTSALGQPGTILDPAPQEREGRTGHRPRCTSQRNRRDLSPHSPPSAPRVERPVRHTPPLGSKRAIGPLRYRSGGHVASTPENATYLRFGQKRKFTILPVVDMLTLLLKA